MMKAAIAGYQNDKRKSNIHNDVNSSRNIKRTINSSYCSPKSTTRKGMLGYINLRFT